MADIDLEMQKLSHGTDAKEISSDREALNGKKSNFQKYAESTSVGGLTFVLTGSSKIRRVLWLIILLICVAASFYLLRNSVTKLINRPTATSITNEPNVQLDYPAITICSKNWLNARLISNPAAVDMIRKNIFMNGDCSASAFPPNLQPYLSLPIGSMVQQDPGRVIQACLFGSRTCDQSDFDVTISHNSACYTFNSGKNGRMIERANSSGPPGLTVSLFFPEYDYVWSTLAEVGITVTVHPQNEIPIAGQRGVNVAPGTSAQITIRKRIIDDKTKTHCSETTSIAECTQNILYENIRNKCSCFADVTDLESVERALNVCPLSDMCCYLFHPNINTRIAEECLPKCRSTQFEIQSLSYAKFPAMYNFANVDDPEFYQIASNSSMQVEVFYSTLTVETQTTDHTYGIEEFLAEIGGELGLCIGVSVISLFEFIIYILDEMKDRCFKPLCCKRRIKKDITRSYIP